MDESTTSTPDTAASASAGTEQSPQAAPAASGEPTQQAPVNRQALRSALRRTESIREREAQHKAQSQELERQRAELAPLLEAHGLFKEGKGADAIRRLTGGADTDLIKLYESMTPLVAGLDQSDKALGALPATVRASLERLPELEKRAALVGELEKRLAAIETTRDEAFGKVQEQQQTKAAQDVFAAGFDAMAEEGGEHVDLIASMPRGRERLEARWDAMLEERRADILALPQAQRAPALAALVGEAGKAVLAEMRADLGDALRLPNPRGKMYGNRASSSGTGSRAPSQANAPSTQGKTSPPRTVMPTSLGEPEGVDYRKLSPRERLERLRREEIAALNRNG